MQLERPIVVMFVVPVAVLTAPHARLSGLYVAYFIILHAAGLAAAVLTYVVSMAMESFLTILTTAIVMGGVVRTVSALRV